MDAKGIPMLFLRSQAAPLTGAFLVRKLYPMQTAFGRFANRFLTFQFIQERLGAQSCVEGYAWILLEQI